MWTATRGRRSAQSWTQASYRSAALRKDSRAVSTASSAAATSLPRLGSRPTISSQSASARRGRWSRSSTRGLRADRLGIDTPRPSELHAAEGAAAEAGFDGGIGDLK